MTDARGLEYLGPDILMRVPEESKTEPSTILFRIYPREVGGDTGEQSWRASQILRRCCVKSRTPHCP
eukprot:8119673-Pyramimonas_sp.AAC.1